MECKFATVEQANQLLESLSKNSSLQTSSDHSLYWHFTHLAQSINYSIVGYPVMRPKWLQLTVGKLVFKIFLLKGKMSHNINEPIPGAEPIAEKGDWQAAVAKLQQTLIAFNNYHGKLSPHFMYGLLSKENYIRAHLMHLANHLEYFN